MSEVIERESTELVTLPPKESALQVYSIVGGLDPLIEQIRAKVAGTVYSMKTAKSRAECASDAAKVAKSKMAIERLGKELSAQYKEIPKKIDAERKRAFDALEILQKEVRQPLTEWEQAEERRVANHKHEIAMLQGFSECGDLDAGMIRANIEHIEGLSIDESWEEFEAEAHRVKARTLETMRAALSTRERYEAEQAELAALRRKQAEQDQKDRDAETARKAAEKARSDAEAEAQAERDAAAKREADARAAQAKAEQDAEDAVERQKQAEARAEAEKLAAVKRAEEAAEAARLAEVKRQDDDRAAEAAAQRRREADREHKSKVLRKAKESIMSAGITEDQARAVIKLISAGKVPNVQVNY